MKLYDGRQSRWRIIEIDDYLPCSHYGGIKPDLIFGKIHEGSWGVVYLRPLRIGFI